MASKDVKFMGPKEFKWLNLETKPTLTCVAKQKEGPKKSYKQKWIALYFNYLLYFKVPSKGAKEPLDKDVPQGVLELEKVIEPVSVAATDKGGPNTLCIKTDKKEHYLNFEDREQKLMTAWQANLQQTIDRLKNVARTDIQEVNSQCKKAQNILRGEKLKIPLDVPAEGAEEYVDVMAQQMGAFKEFGPQIKAYGMFAENHLQTEKAVKRYIDWFVSHNNVGVGRELTSSVDSVLGKWKDKCAKGAGGVVEAYKKSFFLEDLKGTLQEIERTKKLIVSYNKAMVQLENANPAAPFFQQELADIDSALNSISSTPSLRSVNFDGASDGEMTNGDAMSRKWRFVKYECVLQTEQISVSIIDPVAWDCSLMHAFTNQTYGTIIWNGVFWAWTHPTSNMLIKYRWDPNSHIFQLVVGQEPQGMKPSPNLVDWQLQVEGGNSILRAVTVGAQRTAPPEAPQDVVWNVTGAVPPPVSLLGAMFYYLIQPVVKGTKQY